MMRTRLTNSLDYLKDGITKHSGWSSFTMIGIVFIMYGQGMLQFLTEAHMLWFCVLAFGFSAITYSVRLIETSILTKNKILIHHLETMAELPKELQKLNQNITELHIQQYKKINTIEEKIKNLKCQK